MKKSKTVLIKILVIVLLIAGLVVHLNDTRLKREKNFIATCSRIFEEDLYDSIAVNDSPLNREMPLTEHVAKLFSQQSQLEYIDIIDTQTIRFTFTWSNFAPEAHADLVYVRGDHIDPALFLPDHDEWVLEEKENSILFSGGGINREGYIKIERIITCWYDVKIYYPT